jgi:predicted MPP superfamily phosphohydrolase
MSYLLLLLLLAAALGHVIFWAAIVNRTHGIGIQRRVIDGITAICAAMMAGVPLAIAAVFWKWLSGDETWGGPFVGAVIWIYLGAMALCCIYAGIDRLWRALHWEHRGALIENHTARVDMRAPASESHTAPGIPSLLARVPLNEVLELQVHEKRLLLSRLPAGHAELRIAHISDLHMSGRIRRSYFERAVEEVNRLEPDLIAITGDIVDREACVAWLPETLGKLRAPAGVYYVRGNHDRRIRQEPLVTMLAALGIVHLGGICHEVTVRGTPLVLAGNELPWFGPAPQSADIPPRTESGLPLRILLAHGPDQFTWAAEHDFDLMLAGHNHGGQIRMPILGAILAPSLSGTRYACGVFRRGDTVLHVSRGTGSLTPVRWNCPPEIALLQLAPGDSAPVIDRGLND